MSAKNWKRYYMITFDTGGQTHPFKDYREARQIVRWYQKRKGVVKYRVTGILAVRGRTNACFGVQQQLAECSS